MTAPRALIAEDEPLLAAALEQELARAWPELAIAVRVGDGLSAVRQALAQRGTAWAQEQTLAQLRQLAQAPGLDRPPTAAPLTLLQASRGNQIHMVALAEVLYFEAADKYLRVLTARQEYLIRTPLRELVAQLDPAVFWQVHRGTLVRATAIASA